MSRGTEALFEPVADASSLAPRTLGAQARVRGPGTGARSRERTSRALARLTSSSTKQRTAENVLLRRRCGRRGPEVFRVGPDRRQTVGHIHERGWGQVTSSTTVTEGSKLGQELAQ